MSKEITLEDFAAKDRKDMPFEERAKKFEEAVGPLSKEWGVGPGAVLQGTESIIAAVPIMKDLWDSGKK